MSANTRYFKSHARVLGCYETYWLVDGECIRVFHGSNGTVSVYRPYSFVGRDSISTFNTMLELNKNSGLLITSK